MVRSDSIFLSCPLSFFFRPSLRTPSATSLPARIFVDVELTSEYIQGYHHRRCQVPHRCTRSST
ncbi:hypothetical protein FIBSPDRAFT_849907 [Athelia psychrophila]|uniref:Uncharacterized protein n=1 Tax=Athelia psychrophila TaxID=1759441 RepID=A0A166TR28_9AGAM|nr:hypothetical protein FIBSPDRAFT_849907 [Fibularhizoctonia sp. CBS 109695]